MPVLRRAENAFDQVVEEAVVIFLLLDQRDALLLACDGAMDGVAQRGRRELLAAEVLLRAAEHGLGEKGLVLAGADDQHRELRRLGGEQSDLDQRGGVDHRDVEQHGVKIVRREHRQPGVRGRLNGHVHGVRRVEQQFAEVARGIRVAADQQNFEQLVFHAFAVR